MKNFKKLISALLACTMICAVSVTSFAFSNAAGYYTVEFKVQDAEGNVITEAAAGSDVYVATYIYETANPNADVVIAANKSAELVYELDVPVGFMADESSYEGADYTSIDNVVAGAASGTATITDFASEGFYAIENTAVITSGITLSNDVAVLKNKITLSDELGVYELMSFSDTFMFSDGLVYANGCEAAVTEFEIVAAGGDEGGDDDTISATKTEAANGANTNTYTFENSTAMAGKKVVMQNAKMPTSGMTADTRFIVSDGTRTQIFGSDIWAKLGAEGDGVIDVDNVIFGIIVDAANTSTFTFEVK